MFYLKLGKQKHAACAFFFSKGTKSYSILIKMGFYASGSSVLK